MPSATTHDSTTHDSYDSYLVPEVCLESVDGLPGDAAVQAARICRELPAVREGGPSVPVVHPHRTRRALPHLVHLPVVLRTREEK